MYSESWLKRLRHVEYHEYGCANLGSAWKGSWLNHCSSLEWKPEKQENVINNNLVQTDGL